MLACKNDGTRSAKTMPSDTGTLQLQSTRDHTNTCQTNKSTLKGTGTLYSKPKTLTMSKTIVMEEVERDSALASSVGDAA